MLANVGEDVANILALINAIDDAPMGQARMWVDEPAEDGMAGYRRLAAGVITQLAQFIGLCSSLKWSSHLTKSPFLALPATAGSNAAYKIISACSNAVS